MKYLKVFLLVVGVMLTSCGKGGDDDNGSPTPPIENPDNPNPDNPNPDEPDPDKPEYPTYDAPHWTVSDHVVYEYSMTAIVCLPDSLVSDESAADELAVFSASVCHGVAERIEVSKGQYVWMALIYGDADKETLSFKYYSSKTRHIYESIGNLVFNADGRYGSLDNPEMLGFRIKTE